VAHTLTARLVVLPPRAGGQKEVALDRDRLLIGRDPRSDLVLDDSGVSWQHAEVSRSGDRWMVRDLGSTNGTVLGGRSVGDSVEIRNGDVLMLGHVQVRLEDPRAARAGGPATTMLPPVNYPTSGIGQSDPEARFSVGDQWAKGTINNIEGMQNNYVHQVLQQRESFLREVAATRTKARWFVWLGLILFILGLAAALYAFISAGISISSLRPGHIPNGREFIVVFGFGAVANVAGEILIVVGIVLHVIATARRRRLNERLPAPVPRPPTR
jgi:FHA domain-containing protein